MKKVGMLIMMLVVTTSTVAISQSAGPPDERMRSAYKMLLAETDANKDGTLSITECKVIFKDPATADNNCKFWDVDHDGLITENEYVEQIKSIGKKK